MERDSDQSTMTGSVETDSVQISIIGCRNSGKSVTFLWIFSCYPVITVKQSRSTIV
ncbi:MAG: hypothetical protein ACI845_003634 [Gammaproteobacteria bacterium]|jgi:hypothetical protein